MNDIERVLNALAGAHALAINPPRTRTKREKEKARKARKAARQQRKRNRK